jgi:hypothetical protein
MSFWASFAALSRYLAVVEVVVVMAEVMVMIVILPMEAAAVAVVPSCTGCATLHAVVTPTTWQLYHRL